MSLILLLLIPIVLLAVLLSLILIAFLFPSSFDIFGLIGAIRGMGTVLTDLVGSEILKIMDNFWIYFPLAVIGAWRWAVWIFKRTCAQLYIPIQPSFPSPNFHGLTLSIITPVYNEDPKMFRRALDSWALNKPSEIIAVIDQTDIPCIEVFKHFSESTPSAKLIITSKPGKRPALADGIIEAKSEIVALVDSDTIWAANIKEILLAPFKDPAIGGVTMRNHPIECHSLWQKMTDIFWDMRNFQDLPSQTAMGRMLTCLSGRSSLYRREIILPMLHGFLNEVLLGIRKESGEDKCLTRLIQQKGWSTYYQGNAEVYSSASMDFKTFWRQRVRWTRNSHNSDLISLWDGWVWRHPFLAFYMIDRFIATFTLFLGPIFLGIALFLNEWFISLSIIGLWLLGRGIKIIPHIKRKPKDILILPVYIAVNFLIAFAKLYALVTLREQVWIRAEGSHTSRRQTNKRIFERIKDMILTTEIIGSLVILVAYMLR
jgi:glycosyltransferase involved in cell wall biosynthesis